MNNQTKIEQLENRADRTQYTGKFNDLQTFGSSFKGKRYSDEYSEQQNFLYKRALFGLKMYKEKEIKAMHPGKVDRIKHVSSRAQQSINHLKQQRLIEITNKIFGMFNKSTLAGEIIDLYSTPVRKSLPRKFTFNMLAIDKEMVIDKLLTEKILPPDYKRL